MSKDLIMEMMPILQQNVEFWRDKDMKNREHKYKYREELLKLYIDIWNTWIGMIKRVPMILES